MQNYKSRNSMALLLKLFVLLIYSLQPYCCYEFENATVWCDFLFELRLLWIKPHILASIYLRIILVTSAKIA